MRLHRSVKEHNKATRGIVLEQRESVRDGDVRGYSGEMLAQAVLMVSIDLDREGQPGEDSSRLFF